MTTFVYFADRAMETDATQLDQYYLKQPEPMQGCLLALKDLVMRAANGVTHERKFQIPFFYYKGKKLAYLWVNRKKLQMGFAEDRAIQPSVAGLKRKDKYESILINPAEDLPMDDILERLERHLGKINAFSAV